MPPFFAALRARKIEIAHYDALGLSAHVTLVAGLRFIVFRCVTRDCQHVDNSIDARLVAAERRRKSQPSSSGTALSPVLGRTAHEVYSVIDASNFEPGLWSTFCLAALSRPFYYTLGSLLRTETTVAHLWHAPF